jgi:hypothetical protein
MRSIVQWSRSKVNTKRGRTTMDYIGNAFDRIERNQSQCGEVRIEFGVCMKIVKEDEQNIAIITKKNSTIN